MKKIIMAAIFYALSFSTVTFADTVTTTTEYGVPIVVQKDSYTVRDPDYYYYEGHRCYTKERSDIGVNFLGLKAGVSGGTSIYCYPYSP